MRHGYSELNISGNKKKTVYANFELKNGDITYDKYVAYKEASSLYENVGPQLAANISNQNKIPECYVKGIDSLTQFC